MSGFSNLAHLSLFFFVLWFASNVSRLLWLGILGELLTGVIFVPILGFVPYTDALTLFGSLGIAMLIIDGGLHLDRELLRRVWLRSLLTATVGALLSVVVGLGMFRIAGKGWFESLSVGTALASTSIAIAVEVVRRDHILTTSTGALISSAAIIDDVWSLVLLSVTVSLAPSASRARSVSTGEKVWNILHPVLASAGVLLVAGLFALFLIPWMVAKLRRLLQLALSEAATGTTRIKFDQQFLLVLLITYSFVTAYLSGLAGSSYLIGAFLGGFAFSSVPDARTCWATVVSPVQKWLVMIFFASMGFLVPITSIFSPRVLLLGAILTVLAFAAKLVTGFFASPLRYFWVLGLAMVGRGELGLLLAAEAKQTGVMGDDSFGATIWAILLCTLIAPFAFRFALARHRAELQREAQP